MKKKILLATIGLSLLMCGCTEQNMVRQYGGDMTVHLPENTKLEEITWKDDCLWYLTRPMREDEEAETHLFQESSSWGVFEGTVTIVESKEEVKDEE